MSNIKKFVDRITLAEGRNSREVVLTLNEAKELRDEITKMLIDQRNTKSNDVIEVVMQGGKFK